MVIFGSDDSGAYEYIKQFSEFNKLKIFKIKNKRDLEKIKIKIKIIITGTALGKSFDKYLWEYGRKHNIITVALLEHWTNFKIRFKNYKTVRYPDYIIVNDKYSFKACLKSGLPVKNLIVSKNPIFSKNIQYSKKKLKKQILLISEKTFSKKTEEKKLNFYNQIINNFSSEYKIIIKAHPKEKKSDFKSIIQNKKIVFLNNNRNLKEIINSSKFIIGFKSILLVKISQFRNDIMSFFLRGYIDKNFMPYDKKCLFPVANFFLFKKIINEDYKIKNLIFDYREKSSNLYNLIRKFN